MKEKEARKLAEKHWERVEPLVLLHFSPVAIATMKYLSISFMVHGIKHLQEEKDA